MKPKNRVIFPFLLTLLVILGLATIQSFPPLSIADIELRPVSLFSDVLIVEKDSLLLEETTVVEEEEEDSVIEEDSKPKNIVVVAPPGVVAIEDFSYDMPDSILGNRHGMAHFYRMLDQRNSLGRPVRIAYYGDSFIEGDLMTSDLRAKLQTAYGGCGVGFVDIDSPIAGFRVSVKSYAENWASYSATDKTGFLASKQGIAERYFVPLGEAKVRLQGVPHPALHQDTCQESALFFRLDEPMTISARINHEKAQQFHMNASSSVQRIQVNGQIGEVQWNLSDSLSGEFFGATMDGSSGIILDNFALRGSGGTSLNGIPNSTLQDFAALREYDLIIFQFGLNVADNKVKDYSHYQKQMANVIRKFAKAYPEASLLVVGMSDRGERENGEVVTMPCVKYLNHYQKQLAKKTGCCYWNLFEAMGGEGSIGRMVNDEKPALANMDYTHINARGGRFIAGLLFDAIQAGKEFYDEGRAAE